MKKLILKLDYPLQKGKILERINRFTLKVKFNSKIEKVYLPNPGRLTTVLKKNREVLCEPNLNKKRKTNFKALAVKVKNFYTIVNSSFANKIFQALIEKNLLKEFSDYFIFQKEKKFPLGRIDFVLTNPKKEKIFIEVKACTYVEKGIAKFPDAPTERGRRHLKLLTKLALKGKKCFIVFIIHRPDAKKFKPFAEIDPKFTQLFQKAIKAGVKIKILSVNFQPPNLYLEKNSLLS